MSANPKLDPYTAKAENDHLTPQEKIDGLKTILKTAGAGMLTTLSKDGHLHSRAMHPSSFEGLHFQFLGNNVSQKFDEIGAHTQVNISFYNHTNTDWASVSGVASISQDKELIKKLWSPFIKGYFTDLGDGVHKGDYNDPRVSVITVVPDEIRYWVCTSGTIGKAVEHAKGAITGHTSAPGEMRTITKQEIQLVEGLNRK